MGILSRMVPAPIWRRFLALFIDWLIILAYASLLFGGVLLVTHFWLHHLPNLVRLYGPWGAHLVGFVALTLPVGLYFIATEASVGHASLGKRIAKIRVKSTSKNRLGVGRTTIRTAIKLLPWELAHTAIYWLVAATEQHRNPSTLTVILLVLANILPLVYIAYVVFRRDHRAPHDMFAKTIVVAD